MNQEETETVEAEAAAGWDDDESLEEIDAPVESCAEPQNNFETTNEVVVQQEANLSEEDD